MLSRGRLILDARKGRAVRVEDSETQADQWSSDFLVPRPRWEQFQVFDSFRESYIRQIAEEQGIAPGIVVGRLQHEGRLPWRTR